MCSHSSASYHPALSPTELDQALALLCASARRTEWLLCRYLADMADESRFRAVGWFSDVQHYARTRFGLGVKLTRERVRMGRALRELPRIEQAFVQGTLSYSRVREVTRVATAETESEWLALATRVSMRELERQVAGHVGAVEVCDAPATARWRTPETVELSMHLPAETWALLRRAMQGARQVAESSLSDAEALDAVAREALAAMAQPDATDIADPRKALVLYRCSDCRQTELETNAGAVPLSPRAAERLAAGARRIDLATEGRCEACVGGVMPAAVRRAVLARDRGKCRICGRRRYVDVHHFHPQSEGGEHRRENCGVLCGTCHGAVHDGQLVIRGSAEGALTWFDAAGNELGSEQAGRESKGLGLSEHTCQVLAAMGGRGGFSVDALCEETGLSALRVGRALLELELMGQVTQHWGIYSPAGAPGCESDPSEQRELCPRVGRRDVGRALSERPEACPNVGHPEVGGALQPSRALRPATEHPTPRPLSAAAPSPSTDAAAQPLPHPRREARGFAEAPAAGEDLMSAAPDETALDLAPPTVRERILSALHAAPEHRWHPDTLCEKTGLRISEVMAALLELEMTRQIRMVSPGVYAPRHEQPPHRSTLPLGHAPQPGTRRRSRSLRRSA